MDNASIARILNETADLLEISGGDPFRIRSYRRASETVSGQSQSIHALVDAGDEKAVLEIPGIGKGMLANFKELHDTGKLVLHQEMLDTFGKGVLELFKVQGLGPKTIALIWDTYKVADLDGVEKLAKEGKIRVLPRMGEKQEQKILKGVEDLRKMGGRFRIDVVDDVATSIISYLKGTNGVEQITPAGSLRRGRETAGDLDILVTGKGCANGQRKNVIAKILAYPGIAQVLAQGENKVSFKLENGLQVDVRLLPPGNFGAALLYFTGSKNHNVVLRQRALKKGFTLNEYALTTVKGGKTVAAKTEEEIYKKLGLAWMPPEIREAQGEIESAEDNSIPELIELNDIRGDVHMHTVATDGRNTIEEMADAAQKRGLEYIAITDHSKNLAMANGLDDKRALAHIKAIRKADANAKGIRIFAGIEVDILADGSLDLSDHVLSEMDIVIASIHSHFNQDEKAVTERLLRTIDNENVSILGHPTGRLILRREPYHYDFDKVMQAAKAAGIHVELNAAPERLDLNDVHLKRAKELGLKVVINTDSHHTSHLEKMKYGILQARRAWLTKKDVLNTLKADAFLKAMNRLN